MGDGQDRQDAAEGVSVPVGQAPFQPMAPQSEPPATGGSVPDALFTDDAGLTGAIASLEAPEPPSPVPGSEATAVEEVPTAAAGAPDDSDAKTESAAPQPAAADAGAETETAVETSESLDDIAPGTVSGEQAAIEDAKDLALPADRPGVPIWPFVVYFAAWVVFAGLLVWQFMQTPAGMPLYELTIYGPSILVGLVLTVMGPLVAIAVWLVVWLTRPGARSGLFSRCLILGAVATLGGVAVWLVALGAVDMLRLGRLL
jgi:hypothetical protein